MCVVAIAIVLLVHLTNAVFVRRYNVSDVHTACVIRSYRYKVYGIHWTRAWSECKVVSRSYFRSPFSSSWLNYYSSPNGWWSRFMNLEHLWISIWIWCILRLKCRPLHAVLLLGLVQAAGLLSQCCVPDSSGAASVEQMLQLLASTQKSLFQIVQSDWVWKKV